MAPVKNGRVIFNKGPTDYPIPGRTTVYDESEMIDLESVPLGGGILIKTLVAVSIDPYLRRMIIDFTVPSTFPPFRIGQTFINHAVGVVFRSENPSSPKGSHVVGLFPFQEYTVLSGVHPEMPLVATCSWNRLGVLHGRALERA